MLICVYACSPQVVEQPDGSCRSSPFYGLWHFACTQETGPLSCAWQYALFADVLLRVVIIMLWLHADTEQVCSKAFITNCMLLPVYSALWQVHALPFQRQNCPHHCERCDFSFSPHHSALGRDLCDSYLFVPIRLLK